MTFPKWRSYSYKPLESRHKKRRNTIAGGAVRTPGKASAEQLSLSGSLTRSGEGTEEGTAQFSGPVENGATQNGSVHAPPPPTLSRAPCSGEWDPASGEREDLTVSPPCSGGRGRRAWRSLSVPGWTASLLRSGFALRRRPSGSRQLHASLSPSPEREEVVSSPDSAKEDGGESDSVPEATDAEIEAALQEAWSSILAAGETPYGGFLRRKQALEYSRKMAQLRQQYQLKLAEILQREATFAREFLSHDESTPLLRADQLTAPAELRRAIRDTQTSGRFDKLRLELKRETAVSATALRARYPSLQARLREEKLRRPRSCHWPASSSLVYCNPHCEAVQQSGSMVGICDGFYSTDNYSDHESLYLSGSRVDERY